jgi:CRISPR-associated exonuclease Cas4
MSVRSLELGVSGQCDIVEFHAAGGDSKSEISDLRGRSCEAAHEPTLGHLKSQISDFKSTPRVVPVEYKRGKPKTHRADEVQLCAQAMCLEEMLGVAISNGCLFYGENRRRTTVEFDTRLRQLVVETSMALHAMIDSRQTPTADYLAKRCDACSLIDLCQPQAMRFKKGAAAWFSSALKSHI